MIFTLDATLDKCPLPLVKLRIILKKMKVEDTCVMLISDKGSKKDIPKLLLKKGYSYSENCINDTVVELKIKTGKYFI